MLLGSAPDPRVQGEFNALAGELSYGGEASFCFYYDGGEGCLTGV